MTVDVCGNKAGFLAGEGTAGASAVSPTPGRDYSSVDY